MLTAVSWAEGSALPLTTFTTKISATDEAGSRSQLGGEETTPPHNHILTRASVNPAKKASKSVTKSLFFICLTKGQPVVLPAEF